MIAAWTQLFGLVSFELFGQTRNVIHHHAALLDATASAMATVIGLPGKVQVDGVQRDDAMAPDDEFEPGGLEHIVAGNTCRLLDARRTPLRIIDVDGTIATFVVEVLAFEDTGARWDLAFERVVDLQFPRGSRRAGRRVSGFTAAVARVARPLDIELDEHRRDETLRRWTRRGRRQRPGSTAPPRRGEQARGSST